MSRERSPDRLSAQLSLGLWWETLDRVAGLKRQAGPLVAVAVVIAGLDIASLQLTRWVIDGVVRARAEFGLYIAVYAAIALGQAGALWLVTDLIGGVYNRLAHDIREEAFGRLQELDFAFFDSRPTGWLVARLTADCERLSTVIPYALVDLCWAACLLLLMAGSLLLMNARLGLIAIGTLFPFIVAARCFRRLALERARRVSESGSQLTADFHESIQGIRATKALVREERSLSEFGGLASGMFGASVRQATFASVYQPMVSLLGSLAAGLVVWRGGGAVAAGVMSVGTLVAFIHTSDKFFGPVNFFTGRLSDLQSAQAAGERVLGLVQARPAITDALAGAEGPPEAVESVEFRRVCFRYGRGPMVLEDFSLRIEAGRTVALVGPSGGGKSSIVSLLSRFYEPCSGQILINGRDYRTQPLAWLRSRLGVVPQTPHIFRGTVRENIRYGRLEAGDEEVEACARLVDAHLFAARMERGLDSEVGEGGNRLSSGQRQQIALARVLLADPEVVVMDEATSSIDAETERRIQRGLAATFAGRINFVIAHRLSTVREAHLILVVDRGRIVESGAHAELMARRGAYFRLYTSQFHREREEALLQT